MNRIVKKSNKKAAFTIIELLTVMSIIVVLISLLVPALNRVNRYAKDVRQKTQFKGIDDMMGEFSKDSDAGGYGDYPPSDALDEADQPYCGAMKFAEAMVGQDLLGFNPDSRFRQDLTIDGDPTTTLLYDYDPTISTDDPSDENIKSRQGPLLRLEGANAHRMWHLYGRGNTAPFREDLFVLCDVYNRVRSFDDTPGAKRRIGMPILYYKADISGIVHLPDAPWNPLNIYNYEDNHYLIGLGKPEDLSFIHPLFKDGSDPEGQKFYEITKDYRISIERGRPYRSDSYILLSAGFDGEYGTRDDVFNFIRRR